MAELDLLNTPYAKSINARLGELHTIGNEGSTGLDKLTIDTVSMQIKARIKVVAAHSWGKIVWTDYFSFPPVDNEENIGVSATAFGEAVLDLSTMSVGVGFRIPLGERSVTVLGKKYKWNFGELRMTADQIKRVMSGDIMALTDSIPTLGVIGKGFDNEYDETLAALKAKYGPLNVYLARKDPFVDSLCPSKGFAYMFSLILTGGGSAPLIMKEVAALALSELVSLTDWLTARGIAAASSLANAILSGKGVTVPNYYLAVKWTPIRYRSWSTFLNEKVTPNIEEMHGAFYVVVKARTGGPNAVNSDGFDTGPIGGVDFPGTLVPPPQNDPGETKPSINVLGLPATNGTATFRLDIDNLTDAKIRILVLRGALSPSFFAGDLEQNQSTHTHATGANERVVGVWEISTGRLLVAATIWIDQDLHIFVGGDRSSGKYWLGYVV